MMTRDQIVAANPLLDLIRARGHEVKPSNGNYTTNGCPVVEHKKPGHYPVTIYPETQSFHCHDCSVGGSVIDYVMHWKSVEASEALRILGGGRNGNGSVHHVTPPLRASRHDAREAEQAPTPTVDWEPYREACTEKNLEELAEWRGYSDPFVEWLHKSGLLGRYNGCWAFPVHDKGGNVVGVHYRIEPQGKTKAKWFYKPKGIEARPLVIGDLSKARVVHLLESTWDGLALCDKIQLYRKDGAAVIITRGAGNTTHVRSSCPPARPSTSGRRTTRQAGPGRRML